jgi:hypothetical protein
MMPSIPKEQLNQLAQLLVALEQANDQGNAEKVIQHIDLATSLFADMKNQLLPDMSFAFHLQNVNNNIGALQDMSKSQLPDIDRIIPLWSNTTASLAFCQERLAAINNYINPTSKEG